MTMQIEEIAKEFNAAVIHDRNGEDLVAIQRRIYDADGLQEVRYYPDPCDFHPHESWESAAADQLAKMVS